MQTFPVSFSRNPVTVLILLTIPSIAAAVFITPLILFPQTPQWLVILTIIVMMIVGIAAVKFIIKKWGAVKADAAMDELGITIRLQQRSLFYPRVEFAGTWEEIENVSTNFDPQHSRRFYLISFRRPAATVSLMPADIADADSETPFGKALLQYVSGYNKAHAQTPIKQRGFYDTWWAKVLTVFVYLMIFIVLIMRFIIPERISPWKMLQVFVFGIMWLGVYHINRRKRA